MRTYIDLSRKHRINVLSQSLSCSVYFFFKLRDVKILWSYVVRHIGALSFKFICWVLFRLSRSWFLDYIIPRADEMILLHQPERYPPSFREAPKVSKILGNDSRGGLPAFQLACLPTCLAGWQWSVGYRIISWSTKFKLLLTYRRMSFLIHYLSSFEILN